jgi:hypothetical protein
VPQVQVRPKRWELSERRTQSSFTVLQAGIVFYIQIVLPARQARYSRLPNGKQVCVWNHDLSLIIGLDDRRAGLNFLHFFS